MHENEHTIYFIRIFILYKIRMKWYFKVKEWDWFENQFMKTKPKVKRGFLFNDKFMRVVIGFKHLVEK